MGYIKIAGAAINQTPIDWENNFKNIVNAIELAKAQQVQLLCLPELCITGYGCEDLFLSDWIPAKAVEILFKIKEYCDGITVSVGLPIKLSDKLYNCACLISNKKILGISAKQFLANDGVHYEARWFTPWQAGNTEKIYLQNESIDFGDLVYEAEGVTIGFEICEDAWRSDEVRPAARLCKKNIQLILNPSASHFAFDKSQFRCNLIVSSSLKFNCTYLYADLLGNEAGRMIYDGEVLIARNGKLIQQNDRLSFNNVNLVAAEVDFEAGSVKEAALAYDERDRNYEFYEATSLALFDYLRKSRSKGFVLSLSGGADSSACTVMVAEMVKKGIKELGVAEFIKKAGLIDLLDVKILAELPAKEQSKKILSQILHCAYQGTVNSGSATFNSAKELAQSIGAQFYYWTIDKEVDDYRSEMEKALGRKLLWETDDLALQNIQARARSPIIWMLANIKNALLITTSNRSEGDVGYATMDGDTSGSIAPIAGVDKYFIQQWLKWAEVNLDQPGLKHVNSLTPTAELRPAANNQTDEADLMPYKIIVEIERLAIKRHLPPLEVYAILSEQNLEDKSLLKAHIIKFYRMWARTQWKRERIAPSFHLDDFNIDPRSWCRFPILSGSFEEEIKLLQEYSS